MVALGATFVMTINEFDLSIGNIVSLGGVVAALLSIQGVPIPVCFLAAVVAGLIVGCVNGGIVAKFGILSFITTLGMGTVLDGVIYGLTGGTTVFHGIPKAFTIPGILKIAGIPFITIVAAVLYIVFHMFMNTCQPEESFMPSVEARRLRRRQASGSSVTGFSLLRSARQWQVLQALSWHLV